jgi:hypothetical protein
MRFEVDMRSRLAYIDPMKDKRISEYMARIGKKGGKKRLQTMTAKERKERAARAAKARWTGGKS